MQFFNDVAFLTEGCLHHPADLSDQISHGLYHLIVHHTALLDPESVDKPPRNFLGTTEELAFGPCHCFFNSGVVMEPIRASLDSVGSLGLSVPGGRVTCDPYSPTSVPAVLVRAEKPVISTGPLSAGPVRLQVRFGMPSTSSGLPSAFPSRRGVTPLVEVENVHPSGDLAESGTKPSKLKMVKKSGLGASLPDSTVTESSILILKW